MRLILAGALATLPLLSQPGMAALSGYYDSVEQIQLILSSEALADKLGQMPIKSLEFQGADKTGRLEWEVETERCELSVFLQVPPKSASAPPMVGKTVYEIAEIGACE